MFLYLESSAIMTKPLTYYKKNMVFSKPFPYSEGVTCIVHYIRISSFNSTNQEKRLINSTHLKGIFSLTNLASLFSSSYDIYAHNKYSRSELWRLQFYSNIEMSRIQIEVLIILTMGHDLRVSLSMYLISNKEIKVKEDSVPKSCEIIEKEKNNYRAFYFV